MITITGQDLTIDDVIAISRQFETVRLSEDTIPQIQQSRQTVERLLKSDKTIYGINTGFGELSNTRIDEKDLDDLQHNLIRSHACGVGGLAPTDVVRAMMLLRINSLIKGYSGIHLKTIQHLTMMLNKRIHPIVPQKGSLGASGDLIPLAHMGLAMIGEGMVEYNGEQMPASEALASNGMSPLQLKAKEGLALINGTPYMGSLGCLGLADAKSLLKNAQLSGAMALEALKGTNQAFRSEIHEIRPHPGQNKVASNLWRLLKDSPIMSSHRDCGRVQDAYTLRCMPQVFGATHDVLTYVDEVLTREINSVTDNPIILSQRDEAVSGGNFHGQPLAYALDFLAIAVSEIGNLLERQIARMVDSKESGLPPFLTQDSGLNSGYMIPQYAVAALLAENKILSHPASTDSIPTSANKEDHVSMGATAGLKARTVIDNTETIIAIHMLLSTQAIDFHTPLKSSIPIQAIHDCIRSEIPHLDNDRYIGNEIDLIKDHIEHGTYVRLAEQHIGMLD